MLNDYQAAVILRASEKSPGAKPKVVAVRLTSEVYQDLYRAAELAGVKTSDLVRAAVEEFVQQ